MNILHKKLDSTDHTGCRHCLYYSLHPLCADEVCEYLDKDIIKVHKFVAFDNHGNIG